MSIEIEAKFKLQDPAPLRERIKNAQGSFLKNVLEINVFFDTPAKSLLATDQGLRIRANTDLITGQTHVVVTHKGPRAKGKLKSRAETELQVADLQAGCRLFEALGYVQTIWFEKRRESWLLGPVKIELDTLPILGSFIEIEGQTDQAVMQAVAQLGLEGGDFLTESYAAMLDQAVPADSQGFKRVAFDADSV